MSTPLQSGQPNTSHLTEPNGEAATVRDAARYRWLTDDHADPATREKCRELLYRMPVMSYAAASHAIDVEMISCRASRPVGPQTRAPRGS